MLDKFGTGWQNAFTKRLEYLQKVLPDVRFISIERFKGMLRITADAGSNDSEYLAKAILYYIERESVKTCEICGKHGFRRDTSLLPVQKCLCLTCYTIEVDNTISQQSHNRG